MKTYFGCEEARLWDGKEAMLCEDRMTCLEMSVTFSSSLGSSFVGDALEWCTIGL